jgi:hypothetical protein
MASTSNNQPNLPLSLSDHISLVSACIHQNGMMTWPSALCTRTHSSCATSQSIRMSYTMDKNEPAPKKHAKSTHCIQEVHQTTEHAWRPPEANGIKRNV